MSFSLTAQGTADKLDKLYQLSDDLLHVEAQSIASNFVGWIFSNFDVTDKQKAFLTGVPAYTAAISGAACAQQFYLREAITFDPGQPPADPAWIKHWDMESSTKTKKSASGTLTVTSVLHFKVYWTKD